MQTRIHPTNKIIQDEYVPSVHFLRFLADAIKGGYQATLEERSLLKKFKAMKNVDQQQTKLQHTPSTRGKSVEA